MPSIFEHCSASLRDVLAFYNQNQSCPCAFPRFRQLASFYFRPYTHAPVGCHITQLAIGLMTSDSGHFVKKDTAGDALSAFSCTICGSEGGLNWEQFSINMDVTSFIWKTIKPAPLGAGIADKIPMPKGFFGLGTEAILACADGFSIEATFDDMIVYLKELRA